MSPVFKKTTKTIKKKSGVHRSMSGAKSKEREKKPEESAAPKQKKEKYYGAVGRRKTSIAQVRLTHGLEGITVNAKEYHAYFPTIEMQRIAQDALRIVKGDDHFKVEAHIRGGGIHAQAEALRHAIARALVKYNADFKKRLKRLGFITRDSRMKERRKFGLKKARKAPQWSKR